MKAINTLKGFYNSIMNPKFWQESSGAEYFVDDLGTGKYYIIRSTDGDKFYKLPGGKVYRNYITAYAALYVWAKSRNMVAVDMFNGFSDVCKSFFATDEKLDKEYKNKGGLADGRTQEAGRACRAFGQQLDSAGAAALNNIYAGSTVH